MLPVPFCRRAATLAAAFLCLALAGCGPTKITKANYDKIQNDMTLAQVEEILGSGNRQGADATNMGAQFGVDLGASAPPPSSVDYVWEKGKTNITVTFRSGKVTGKKFTGS